MHSKAFVTLALQVAEDPPVSLGRNTTPASKPTTVSRPLVSADTAYIVVSLRQSSH